MVVLSSTRLDAGTVVTMTLTGKGSYYDSKKVTYTIRDEVYDIKMIQTVRGVGYVIKD